MAFYFILLHRKEEYLPIIANLLRNTFFLQAPFKLSWGCNGDNNGQHKHDFVSFEKGDITTAPEEIQRNIRTYFKTCSPSN